MYAQKDQKVAGNSIEHSQKNDFHQLKIYHFTGTQETLDTYKR